MNRSGKKTPVTPVVALLALATLLMCIQFEKPGLMLRVLNAFWNPVSSSEQRVKAVRTSMATANRIAQPVIGVTLGRDVTEKLLLREIRRSIGRPLEGVYKLSNVEVTLGNQEICMSSRFHLRLPILDTDLYGEARGTIAIAVDGNEIVLFPAFTRIVLHGITLRNGAFRLDAFLRTANWAVAWSLRNLNAMLEVRRLPVEIRPSPAHLYGNAPNSVIDVLGQEIRLSPFGLGNFVLLVQPDQLRIVSEITAGNQHTLPADRDLDSSKKGSPAGYGKPMHTLSTFDAAPMRNLPLEGLPGATAAISGGSLARVVEQALPSTPSLRDQLEEIAQSLLVPFSKHGTGTAVCGGWHHA